MRALTFQILLLLKDGSADGNVLLERLGELGVDPRPSLPTLYRSLRGALEEGWVEVAGTEDDGTPGRPRQIYRLTGDGEAALTSEARRLRDLAALALGAESAEGRGGQR